MPSPLTSSSSVVGSPVSSPPVTSPAAASTSRCSSAATRSAAASARSSGTATDSIAVSRCCSPPIPRYSANSIARRSSCAGSPRVPPSPVPTADRRSRIRSASPERSRRRCPPRQSPSVMRYGSPGSGGISGELIHRRCSPAMTRLSTYSSASVASRGDSSRSSSPLLRRDHPRSVAIVLEPRLRVHLQDARSGRDRRSRSGDGSDSDATRRPRSRGRRPDRDRGHGRVGLGAAGDSSGVGERGPDVGVGERGSDASVTVETDAGTVDADAVVVATDPPSARELTGVDAIPTDARSCITQYYALPAGFDLETGRRLLLNATEQGPNHVVPHSAVAPEYAPSGTTLISATYLGERTEHDAELAALTRRTLESWYPDKGFDGLEAVHTARVPFAQFAQPPGFSRSCRTSAIPRDRSISPVTTRGGRPFRVPWRAAGRPRRRSSTICRDEPFSES